MWLSLILIIEMFDWCYQVISWCWQMFGWRCHVLYCAQDIHIWAYFPLLDGVVHKWMNIVGYLPHDSNIRYYTRVYCSFDEILFVWRYEDGWLMLVVYIMTLTSDLILWHISPFSSSILEIGIATDLVLDWVLVQSFWLLTISGPSYMDLLR